MNSIFDWLFPDCEHPFWSVAKCVGVLFIPIFGLCWLAITMNYRSLCHQNDTLRKELNHPVLSREILDRVSVEALEKDNQKMEQEILNQNSKPGKEGK